MKKILVIIMIALAVPALLSGQEKGDMFVSGSFTLSGGNTRTVGGNTNSTTPKGVTFGLEPRIGYFVMDRLEVSLGVGYELSRNRTGYLGEQKLISFSNDFTLSPRVSYYIPLGDKFYYIPSFNLSLGFGGSHNDQTQAGDEPGEQVVERLRYRRSSFTMWLSLAAFEFRPVDRVGVTLSMGNLRYETSRSTRKGGTTSSWQNTFSLNLFNSTSIGLKYYF